MGGGRTDAAREATSLILNLCVCSPVEGSVSNQGHVSPFSLMSVIGDGVDHQSRCPACLGEGVGSGPSEPGTKGMIV